MFAVGEIGLDHVLARHDIYRDLQASIHSIHAMERSQWYGKHCANNV